MNSRSSLVEQAPAKVNLTLRVLGRRKDGYHDIASLVAFADVGDRLTFKAGGPWKLTVRGPTAKAAGKAADNLVLKAARALAAKIPGLTQGHFTLVKNLPVAAGLGGGSSDAAAALRLLARANRLQRDDPRIRAVAEKLGSDVPVCLDPRARMMHGTGEILSEAVRIPNLPVVLVNPGRPVATKDVFARYRQKVRARDPLENRATLIPQWFSAFVATLAAETNDLEMSAIAHEPTIAKVLEALRGTNGCELARMSGSGATCFGLFSTRRTAAAAARKIRTAHPKWWVKQITLR